MTNAISTQTQITIRKFSKPGCRPCQVLGYTLEEYADELAALGAAVVEHDITQEPEWIDAKQITSVPVMTFERNGIELGRINGIVHISEILGAVEYAKEAR